MRYNPNVSVVENAKSNNCSEAAVRKYIKVHCIDRRYEQKVGIVNEIRKSIQDNPSVPLWLLKQSTYASSVRGASQSTTPSGDRLQLRNPPESNRQDDVLHPSFHGEYGR